MRSILPVALFALVIIGTSVPALAITVTYTGQVYGGGDNSGQLSGTIDGPFTGQPFTLTYVFNPRPGTINASTTQFSSSFPTGSVNLCLDGNCMSATDYGEIFTAGSQEIYVYYFPYHAAGLTELETYGGCAEFINTSCSITSGLNGSGSFFAGLGILGGAYGSLALDTIVVDGDSLAPAVPEPSTWAMLLIGFAAIGFTGYRKSRQENFTGRT